MIHSCFDSFWIIYRHSEYRSRQKIWRRYPSTDKWPYLRLGANCIYFASLELSQSRLDLINSKRKRERKVYFRINQHFSNYEKNNLNLKWKKPWEVFRIKYFHFIGTKWRAAGSRISIKTVAAGFWNKWTALWRQKDELNILRKINQK